MPYYCSIGDHEDLEPVRPEFQSNHEDGLTSVVLDRRAWVRYGRSEADCLAAGAMKNAGWTAEVCDISLGGIGLIMQHRFRPGTPLFVELRNVSGNFRRTAALRVVHATSIMKDGRVNWLIGCAFNDPISDADFENLTKA